MNKQIAFRMVSYTDPAGKYNEGAPNCGNEDNFYVDDNLGDDQPSHCSPDEVIELSDCGMLMAVADGMGGMNAGEVASQIAIDTVSELFAPGRITPSMAQDPGQRRRYLEDLIREADRRIKKQAAHNPDQEGMGSTIILAWLVSDTLTVSWCGDSRCYRFNPINGIEMLSEDHSYVQDLVRRGLLRYELTFDHPQGNIVTRSLGDPGKEAQPETREFTVCNNDIILLCSDGLSGVLRDRETFDIDGQLLPGDNLENIVKAHTTSMRECREALWEAAERADWYDNVTAILCQIIGGAGTAVPVPRTVASLGPIGARQAGAAGGLLADGSGQAGTAGAGYGQAGTAGGGPVQAGVSGNAQQSGMEQPTPGKRKRVLLYVLIAIVCVLIGTAIGLWRAGVFDGPRDKAVEELCRELIDRSINDDDPSDQPGEPGHDRRPTPRQASGNPTASNPGGGGQGSAEDNAQQSSSPYPVVNIGNVPGTSGAGGGEADGSGGDLTPADNNGSGSNGSGSNGTGDGITPASQNSGELNEATPAGKTPSDPTAISSKSTEPSKQEEKD